MTIAKLTNHPYANACVKIDTNGNAVLVSYTTEVAELTSDGWFRIFGLYSATTRKHISSFIKEYIIFPDGTRGEYKFFKELFEDGYCINIETGEVVEF